MPGCITTQLCCFTKSSSPRIILFFPWWRCGVLQIVTGCLCFVFSIMSFCGNDLKQLTRSRSDNANIYCLGGSRPFSHLQSNQSQPWGSFRKCGIGFSTHSNAPLLTQLCRVTNNLCVEVAHSRRSQASAPSSGHLLMLLMVLRYYLHIESWLDFINSCCSMCFYLWLFIFISFNIDTRQLSQQHIWIWVWPSGSIRPAVRSLGCKAPAEMPLSRFISTVSQLSLQSSSS